MSSPETTEISLSEDSPVPDGTDVLAILGPQEDLTDEEMKQVQAYMKNGGKLFLTLGFHEEMEGQWKNIDALMEQYGVVDEHAIMVDQEQMTTNGPLWSTPEL